MGSFFSNLYIKLSILLNRSSFISYRAIPAGEELLFIYLKIL
ncbi:hypothetical protein [Tenacibaculum maritimum]|nr:hypothetical protein [Tenacibaculum maritimum]